MNLKNVTLIALGLWGLVVCQATAADAMLYWPFVPVLMIGVVGFAKGILKEG